jgi:hypothetical protein
MTKASAARIFRRTTRRPGPAVPPGTPTIGTVTGIRAGRQGDQVVIALETDRGDIGVLLDPDGTRTVMEALERAVMEIEDVAAPPPELRPELAELLAESIARTA